MNHLSRKISVTINWIGAGLACAALVFNPPGPAQMGTAAIAVVGLVANGWAIYRKRLPMA